MAVWSKPRNVALLHGVYALVGLCGSAVAAPLDWSMFSLPFGYGGEAVMAYNGRDTQNIAFEVARDWVRREAYLILGDLGESLIDARLSGYVESWTVDARSLTAIRSNRFATELSEAGELDLSPIGALRPVIERELDAEEIPGEGHNASARTIRVVLEDGSRAEFDVVGGDVAAYRRLDEGGTAQVEVAYLDWKELVGGGRYPGRIVTIRQLPDGTGEAVTETRLVDVHPLRPGSQPPAFRVPEGFSVIDHIEGVSKRADGSVIAPIVAEGDAEPRFAPVPPTGRRASGVAYWKLVVGAGVLMVLTAGIVAKRK
ncbi:MAG: hypothetical protein D6692_01765 [Planctomycetota bacterium]|nr:MAG: hypothetical protein D6692_01765 [Planctomycetota bacterium]